MIQYKVCVTASDVMFVQDGNDFTSHATGYVTYNHRSKNNQYTHIF